MTTSPEDLARREVHYCVSALVSTLARGAHLIDAHISPQQQGRHTEALRDIESLAEHAFILAAPIADYEDAAIQGGWNRETPDALWINHDGREENFTADTAEEACGIDDITPFDREVYEHWIVSDWLADKLAEKGEKVDKDFAGLTVWARTTTGQGIASDSVIEEITRDLNAA